MANAVERLLDLIDELQQGGNLIPEGDERWSRLLEFDAEVAELADAFPDIPLADNCKRIGFCRIPYVETLDGKFLNTSSGDATAGPWRQAMSILQRRLARKKTGESARQPDVWGRVQSALGTLHFDKNGSFIESPHPLKKIAEVAGVSASSLDYSFKAKLLPNDQSATAAERYQRALNNGDLQKLLRRYRGEDKAYGTSDSMHLGKDQDDAEC